MSEACSGVPENQLERVIFPMSDPNLPSVILVGAGRWGRNLARTAHTLSALCAIVDTNPTALERLLEHIPSLSSLARYHTLSAALSNHGSSAVMIATPPSSHFALASQALHAGRDVFLEKPICDNVDQAAQLVDLADRHDCILMVDHLLQYSLPHRQLLQTVRRGELGKLTRVHMTRRNFGTVRKEENVLWSLCPHDISVLLALMSPNDTVKDVRGKGQCVVSKDIEDYVTLDVEFINGVHACVEASWLHPWKERRTVVYGTKGCAILNEAMPDERLPKLQLVHWEITREDGKQLGMPSDGLIDDKKVSNENITKNGVKLMKKEGTLLRPDEESRKFACDTQPLQQAVSHFLHCVQTRERPRTDGKEGLRVLEILTMGSRSLSGGGYEDKDKDTDRGSNGCQVQSQEVERGSKPMDVEVMIHPTAVVDAGAKIGNGSKIWHFAHVMSGAKLGTSCTVGQNVYIGSSVEIGCNARIQNNVSIYDGVSLSDDVFLGPSCVFTNVKTPRGHIRREKKDYDSTIVEKGVSVGANATVVCGVRLGRFCFIGAGAVVTKDVKAFELVYGNPARRHGWVSTTGARLVQDGMDAERLICPESGERFRVEVGGGDDDEEIVRVVDEGEGQMQSM